MPRVKFTKKDILKATYDIMKQDGIQNIRVDSTYICKFFNNRRT